jgi:NADP-dependent 3-hydroxy acid dehydrogenase YdfG
VLTIIRRGDAIRDVLAKTGRIDVLVNNAGMASAGVSEAFTPDQARTVFDTNVIGLLRVTRAVLPTMRKQGDGLVVNIGSILWGRYRARPLDRSRQKTEGSAGCRHAEGTKNCGRT